MSSRATTRRCGRGLRRPDVAAVTDAIDPAAVLDLPGLWPDAAPPSVSWSADGSQVLVTYQVDAGLGPFLTDHGADIGAVAAAFLLLAAATLAWRMLRRPRTVGRRYCTRCNYDVGTADAPPPARCAECGSPLDPRHTPIGQTRLARASPIVSALCVVGTGAALVVAFTGPATDARAYEAWPSAWFGRRWPTWPLWRLSYRPTLEERTAAFAIAATGPWASVAAASREPGSAPTGAELTGDIRLLHDQPDTARLTLFEPSNGAAAPSIGPLVVGGLAGLGRTHPDADGTPMFDRPDRGTVTVSPDRRWVAVPFAPVPPPSVRGARSTGEARWRVWVWPLPVPTARSARVIDLKPGIQVLTAPLPLPDGTDDLLIDGHGTATLVGGVVLDRPAWHSPDAGVLTRTPGVAHAHLRVLDLPPEALAAFDGGLSGPVHTGHGVAVDAIGSEVWVGDTVLRPARWPNEGWSPIAQVIDAGSVPRDAEPDIPLSRRRSEPPRGGTFVPADRDRAARWATADDAWLHGYWNWDWSDEVLPLAKVDAERGEITLGLPHRYGLAQRGRFAVLNAPAELDEPGECWIDRANARIVAWLPEGSETKPVTVTLGKGPLIALAGGANPRRVTVRGVRFGPTRGHAIAGTGVRDAVIEDCAFRGTGAKAVSIDGTGCTVRRCNFEDIGATGVDFRGGDRATLTPAGNAVEDCTFERCGRVLRTYHPAVEVSGVGHRILRNEISELPHIAIVYWGNEHRIEGNLIHHVVQETGDAGAICTGRDWTAHGTVIVGNVIHDIAGSDARYQNAIYVDDMASGITVAGNLVVRCNWGILAGGGRDLVIRDNAFVGCGKAIMFDARGVGWMAPNIADPSTSTLHRKLAEVPIHLEPWRSRYPSLQRYLTDRFGRPVGSSVSGTVLVSSAFGTIEDRECVPETGTEAVAAPADLRGFADDLLRRARTGAVEVGHLRVGPVGPHPR